MCQIRQAGGAGVLGAVACTHKATTRGRQSGHLLQNRRTPPMVPKELRALLTRNFALLAGIAGIARVSGLKDLCRTRLVHFRVLKKT